MRCVWACVIFFVLADPAAAQIYKWVDVNGVTHYDGQPPANRTSKELTQRDASPRQPGDAGAAGAASDLKDRELEFRKRQAMRAQEETRLTQEKARREQECRKARTALADLRNSRRVYETNERGEREYMSDAQRDAATVTREAEYNRVCG